MCIHLGIVIDSTLSWTPHIATICSRAASKIGLLRRFRSRLSQLSTQFLYSTSIRPILEYASISLGSLSKKDSEHLERIQRRAARLIIKEIPQSDTPHDILLARAGLATLCTRRRIARASLAFKFVNRTLPPHLMAHSKKFKAKTGKESSLRNKLCVHLPRPKTDYLKRSPFYTSLSEWNKLPPSFKCANSLPVLKGKLSS